MVKNPPVNAGNIGIAGLISGLGRSLEEGTATHSRILAWRIPWTEEPGGLQSMGLQRVGGEWINKLLYMQTVEYYSAAKRNDL